MKYGIRHLVKRLVPPMLLDIVRGRAAQVQPFIWRGVYPKLSDVPTKSPLFDDILIVEMAQATDSALHQMRSGRKPYLWHEALGLLSAVIAGQQNRVGVLDFGGGLGTGYLQIKTCLPPDVIVSYWILDDEKMCARGRKQFAGDPCIQFLTRLPPSNDVSPDIVYLNSVLQYVENYRGQLRDLAALQAPYILLARVAAGTGPTFASQQLNVPGKILPYWFINVSELNGILGDLGYRLICDELTHRVYDQSNLPPSHRTEQFRDMLFMSTTRSTANA